MKTIALLILALAGCREQDESLVIAEHIPVAEAGYTVPRPEGFEVDLKGRNLRLIESGDLRSPRGLRVRPTDTDARLDENVQTRGDTTYVVVETGAGSGGVVWQLTALKPVGAATVEISAIAQTEGGHTPTFAWAWLVIEGMSPRP